RITRYPLLLRQLLKQTPSSHWEHDQVKQAITLLEKYANQSNLPTETDKDTIPVQNFSKQLRNVPMMVYRPGRTFISETIAYEVRIESSMRLLLFNDVLLISTSPAMRSWGSMTKRTWVCVRAIDLTELSVIVQACVEGNKHVTILSLGGGYLGNPELGSRPHVAHSLDRRISTRSAMPDPDATLIRNFLPSVTTNGTDQRGDSPLPASQMKSPFVSPRLLPSPPHDEPVFPLQQIPASHSMARASSVPEPISASVSRSTTIGSRSVGGRSVASTRSIGDTAPQLSLFLGRTLSFTISPNGEKQVGQSNQDPLFYTLQHATAEAQKTFSKALEEQITKCQLSKFIPSSSCSSFI
ncbi:hypothetical protein BJ085DRAFT_39853, partial [Dimargaris cristalligena]